MAATSRTADDAHRPSRLVAWFVVVTLLLSAGACGSGSGDRRARPEPSPATTSASPTDRTTSTEEAPSERANCPSNPARRDPDGPRAQAQVLQENGPRVEAVVYPRPEYKGNPWSQWGQGIVLADGRYLSTIGDHLGADGNSYLFVYDPDTRELTRFADVLSQVEHERGAWGYGKIHAQLVAGACDEVYVSTYWGSRKGLAYSSTYDGDLLFRIDPGTLALEPLGVPVPKHGIPSLAGFAPDGLLFGEAVDPAISEDRDRGSFFVYDTERNGLAFESEHGDHIGFRNILVGADGSAYIAAEGGRLLRWRPGGGELEELPATLPGSGRLRASTAPGPDGTVYGVTENPDRFFALHPDGAVEDLGEARDYTASIALHPDGDRFFYVPGAHGDGYEQGTPLVEVDAATGDQKVVAELNPLAEQQLGLTVGGSYNVAVDPSGDRVYVGLNAAERGSEEPFGEVVLAIVHL